MDKKRLLRILRAVGLLGALAVPFAYANADSDPPGRVARLNYFSGTVTFAPDGSEDWARMHVNRPLVSGDRVWVDRGSRSEMHIGSTVVRMDGETSLDIVRLDDDTAQLKLTQGTLNLHVRALSTGQVYEIDTPNLAFSVQSPGTYRIDVAPDGDMTTVMVRHGSGVAYGSASSTTMSEGQQVSFTSTDLQMASSAGNPPFDDFDRWANDRDRMEDTATTARYVSRDVIGYEELDTWGSWRSTPQYGMVWVPHVTITGWAPYRTGHWTWISPWGWTWVDDAPWGFAPYHYGRWAYIDRAWCWVPGPIVTVRPVYAPALVAFVGGRGSNFTFSLSIGGAAVPSVGWLPLAPGEIYRPAYVVSPTYIRNVNKTVIVVNNTTINNVTVNKTVYVNRSAPNAITAVPVSVFAKGAPVTSVAKTVPPQLLHHDAAISAAPPVAPPSHPLVGVTQRVEPPPARHIFERPVVATPFVPGHRTVRAALAGREMPTVENRDKTKAPEGVAKMPPPVGQPVPGPSRNATERLTVPPQGEHRIEHGNQSIRHESVPHPPRHAEEHPPVSRGVPIRPTVPHAEERLAPLPGPAPAASLQVPQPHRSEAGEDRHHSAVQHVPAPHQEQGRPEGHEHAQGEHHGRWYGLEKGGHVQHAPI